MKLLFKALTEKEQSSQFGSFLSTSVLASSSAAKAPSSIQDRMIQLADFASLSGRADLAQASSSVGNMDNYRAHLQAMIQMAEARGMSPEELQKDLSSKVGTDTAEQMAEEYTQHIAMKQAQNTPDHAPFSGPPALLGY